jgi:hypothetical protein
MNTYDYEDVMEEVNQVLAAAATTGQVDEAPPAAQPKRLNEKAMTVQLRTSRPTTRFNDEEAAKAARSAVGDDGVGAYTKLFCDPSNPVRQLLAEVGAVYQYHKANTIPYIDRGPRLLPVSQYETYRDTMRTLVNDVDTKLRALAPDYDRYVLLDVAYRNATAAATGKVGRATPDDYPDSDSFTTSIGVTFSFAPLPDNSHWLFDVDDEDKAALDANAQDIYARALSDLRSRVETPLVKLIDVLRAKPGDKDDDGKRVGIFRDTKVTNVVDAVANVKALAMGDKGVLAACEMVETVMAPFKDNPDVLRQSPVVRETALAKLNDVASKMGAFFSAS